MFSSFVVSVYVIGTFTVLVRLALSGTVGVLCWVPLFSICAVALFCTLSSEACSFSLAASVTGDGFVSLWLRGPGLRLQSLSVSTYERSFDLYHIWAIGQLLSYLTTSQVLLCCPATMTSCPISSSGTEYDRGNPRSDDCKPAVLAGNPRSRGRPAFMVNESGFYSLVLSSQLTAALILKRWVASDVLPKIRKYCCYYKLAVLAGYPREHR